MKVLLTGAAGFVGRTLARQLSVHGDVRLRLAVRALPVSGTWAGETVATGDLALSSEAELQTLVRGMDVVIHAAARAHVMQELADDPEAAYRASNTQATLRLAEAAAKEGVRRLVFLSSVKVHGETTSPGQPWTEDSPLQPQDAYARSKSSAESGLRAIGQRTSLEIVLVRPPLVYGPGVGANFLALIRAVHRGIPLPLALLDNRRSLVGVDNLANFVGLCARHPAAAGQSFLVSDGEDLSTPALIHALARAMDRRALLLPVPAALLHAGAMFAGRQSAWQRLSSSLQVDISKARTLLGWQPPCSVAEGLQRCVTAYLHP